MVRMLSKQKIRGRFRSRVVPWLLEGMSVSVHSKKTRLPYGAMACRNHTSSCAIREPKIGGKMSTTAVENIIISSIHSAFTKYPEGDGSPNLDYEWIAPDQSAHIAKAILMDLAASGYAIVKQSPLPIWGQCLLRVQAV